MPLPSLTFFEERGVWFFVMESKCYMNSRIISWATTTRMNMVKG